MAERAALVTGASSGIGLAVAETLGEAGYAITIAARRAKKLKHAAQALRDRGLEINEIATNLSEEKEIQAMVESHRERFGRMDVLVNNAGIGIGGTIESYPTKRLDLQLNVNLRGVFLTTRESIGMLKQAGGEHGRALIANTSSIAGKHGQGWLAAYSATKAGVIGLTQALHAELGNEGVRCTAICPGFVDTQMTDWVKESVPPGQMIQPADIAKAVRFLLDVSPACVVPEIMMIRPGDTM